MVGYNRRFSAHATSIEQAFHGLSGPTTILYRINAGALPDDHWIYDPSEGGGRIIGEVCHFVDLCEYLTDSPIVEVFAASLGHGHSRTNPDENVSITMRHESGSLSSIQYIATGNSTLAKERIEVHKDGKSAVIDDFRSTTFFGLSQQPVRGRQNKGFAEELAAFAAAIRKGNTFPIPIDSLIRTTRTTFAIIDSLKTGKPVAV
jgi:polar amino acid transport system substrate-binding protein